jgi:hypothetical protein
VKKEVGRHLRKTELPGCYDRLVKLITRLEDPVRVKAPGVGIIGNVGQSEGSRVLKELGIGIRKEVWVVKAFVENPEPSGSI